MIHRAPFWEIKQTARFYLGVYTHTLLVHGYQLAFISDHKYAFAVRAYVTVEQIDARAFFKMLV